LPRRGADRPPREPQLDRDRRLRPPDGAAPGRGWRARDRRVLPRDLRAPSPEPALLRRAARLPLERRLRRRAGQPRAARPARPRSDRRRHRPRPARARSGDEGARAHARPPGRVRGRGTGADRMAAARGGRPARGGAGGTAQPAHRRGGRSRAVSTISHGEAAPRGELDPDPPYDYPDYVGTRLRHPTRPLVTLPETLTELTGPVYGHESVGELDHDLTRQAPGEPLGERIIVSGRVLDEAGRPVRDTLVEIWQAN